MNLDVSFDDQNDDVNNVIIAFPQDEDEVSVSSNPVKKLEGSFDTIAKTDGTVSQLRVFLRVRPISEKLGSTISVDSDTSIVTSAPEISNRAKYTKMEERSYTFHKVFGPTSTQDDVYGFCVDPLMERFVQGENSVLIAYGMTNAGKTHTIQGTVQDPGSLPRMVQELFKRDDISTNCDLQLSILEVYQEDIFDLLSKKKDKLKIRDGSGKIEIAKLSSHKITSSLEALKLMDMASQNRSKSKTSLNSGSSRSHAVYTLSLTKPATSERDAVSSMFQIVDLAGAERVKRTDATTAQLREANSINTSLMQLWRCLQGMKKKSADIPFRESKLTHMLMPFFAKAGLQGVTMIACVNPQAEDYDETLSVLTNVSIACKIREISFRPEPAPSVIEKPRMHKSSILMPQKVGQATAGKGKRSSSLISDVTCDTALADYHAGTEQELSNIPFVRGLKEEIERLTIENQQLQNDQWARETEIRLEVSEEMAKRSQHLLERIQELQDELSSKEQATYTIQQSCKKVKRKQRDEEHVQRARDLEEAEDEIERLKAQHDGEILALKQENTALRNEVKRLKSVHENISSTTSVMTASVSTSAAVVAPTEVVPFIEVKPATNPADSFTQRMQRDKRFQRGENKCKSPVKSPVKSPARSPLQAVKDAGNSPLRLKSPIRSKSPVPPVVKIDNKRKSQDTMLSLPEESLVHEKAPSKGNKKQKLVSENSAYLSLAGDDQENREVEIQPKKASKSAFTPILSKLRARFARA